MHGASRVRHVRWLNLGHGSLTVSAFMWVGRICILQLLVAETYWSLISWQFPFSFLCLWRKVCLLRYLSNLLSANFFMKHQIRKEKQSWAKFFIWHLIFCVSFLLLSTKTFKIKKFCSDVHSYLPLDWNVGQTLRLIWCLNLVVMEERDSEDTWNCKNVWSKFRVFTSFHGKFRVIDPYVYTFLFLSIFLCYSVNIG